MVVKCPRWTSARLELSKDEPFNPIRQESGKRGRPLFIRQVFPHHGYDWNYGILPQTWENPSGTYDNWETSHKGNGAALDVCEIGDRVASVGEVREVKVLGILGLIDADDREIHWKVLAIDTADPLAARLNEVRDIENACPGLMCSTIEWLTLSEIPNGLPEMSVAFSGTARDATFALSVINGCYLEWRSLITGGVPLVPDSHQIAIYNGTIYGSVGFTSTEDDVYKNLPEMPSEAPAPVRPSTNKSYHLASPTR